MSRHALPRRRLLALAGAAATTGCAALDFGAPVPATAYDATGEVRGGLVDADYYGDDAGRALLFGTRRAHEQGDVDARGDAAAFLDATDYDAEMVLVVQQVLAPDGSLAFDGASWAGDREVSAAFAVDEGDRGDGHVHTLFVRLSPEAVPDGGIRRVRLRGIGGMDAVYNVHAEPLPDE